MISSCAFFNNQDKELVRCLSGGLGKGDSVILAATGGLASN